MTQEPDEPARSIPTAIVGRGRKSHVLTEELQKDERAQFSAKAQETAARAQRLARVVLQKIQGIARVLLRKIVEASRGLSREAMTWDSFKWAVIVLLLANLFLLTLFYAGTRVKPHSYVQSMKSLRTDFEKEIEETRIELMQGVFRIRSDLEEQVAQTNARLDKLVRPRPPEQSTTFQPPKPTANPRRR